MRKGFELAAFALSIASAAHAQCDTAGWIAQIARGREDVAMERLFRGIALSADERAGALSIFRLTLPGLQSLSRYGRDSLPRQRELLDERNAGMKALLAADADVARFAVNAEESRKAVFVLDPPCPVGEHARPLDRVAFRAY
jgi:hypothetical protein